MSGDETNYAPKSPDLSSLNSAGSTQPAPQVQGHNHHNHHNHHLQLKPEHIPQPTNTSYPSQPLHDQIYLPQDQYLQPPNHIYHYQPHHLDLEQFPYQSTVPIPTAPDFNIVPTFANYPPEPPQIIPYEQVLQQSWHWQDQGSYLNDPAPIVNPPPPPPPPPPTNPAPQTSNRMPPRKAQVAAAPVIEPSPVRTKFPTARIKRIMQADEEVGKVAQQTPIAVGKALELFMIQMVTKSADVAKDKGSKRVSAQMLKQVVETDEQWDFLREIVSRVENEKEGAKAKAKAESSSDEEMEEPKKRRGGRRKKSTS